MRDFPFLKERDGQERRCPLASGLSANYAEVMAAEEEAIV